jgi:hypothetical protein
MAASAAASIKLIMTGVPKTGTFPLPMLGAVCSTPTRTRAVPVNPVCRLERSIIVLDLAPSDHQKACQDAAQTLLEPARMVDAFRTGLKPEFETPSAFRRRALQPA